MPWYDTFASFYDPAIESIYAPYRAQAAAALDLRPDSVVLDLACGTGQNLPYLAGDQRTVIGLDFSAGMLDKARQRAERDGLPGAVFVQADAATVTQQMLDEAAGRSVAVDRALVTLGLSVIPDWEAAFAGVWNLLQPGGRFVVFDVYADRWVPQTAWVQLLARADLKRETWRPLQQVAEGFTLDHPAGSRHVHGGQLVLASGNRPTGR